MKNEGKKIRTQTKMPVQVLICPSCFFPLSCLAIRSVTIHLFLHAMLNLWILLFGKVTLQSIIFFYSVRNIFNVCLTWNIQKLGKVEIPCLNCTRVAFRNAGLYLLVHFLLRCSAIIKMLKFFLITLIDFSFHVKIPAFL